MRKISFIICPDSNGKITVTNTIQHIIENVPQISIPDTDISTIPLAALTLAEDHSKRCIQGHAQCRKWTGGKCTEYEFTLVFG